MGMPVHKIERFREVDGVWRAGGEKGGGDGGGRGRGRCKTF